MLISHNRFQNAPILSLQTGAPLGRTTTPIIDPRQFAVVAFYCEGPRVQGTAILHTSDIREVSGMGLIVDSADSLMSPDGLVRLKTIVDLHFTLLGKPVIDTHKRRLGKVEGYTLDIDSFYIMKINVRQSLIKNFMGGNSLIDRKQIVEVTDKHIVVQAADIKSENLATKPTPILDNPFRRRETPQPNTATVSEKGE